MTTTINNPPAPTPKAWLLYASLGVMAGLRESLPPGPPVLSGELPIQSSLSDRLAVNFGAILDQAESLQRAFANLPDKHGLPQAELLADGTLLVKTPDSQAEESWSLSIQPANFDGASFPSSILRLSRQDRCRVVRYSEFLYGPVDQADGSRWRFNRFRRWSASAGNQTLLLPDWRPIKRNNLYEINTILDKYLLKYLPFSQRLALADFAAS